MFKEELGVFESDKIENNYRKSKDVKRDKFGLTDIGMVGVDSEEYLKGLKLVYVDTVDNSEKVHVCYFTLKDVKDSWGDDWDDAPYEHNAGVPNEYDCTMVAIGVMSPSYGHVNSPYSVEDVNKGAVAWLTDEGGRTLYTGASLEEFISFIKKAPYGMYL